jgi:hypothetical protein
MTLPPDEHRAIGGDELASPVCAAVLDGARERRCNLVISHSRRATMPGFPKGTRSRIELWVLAVLSLTLALPRLGAAQDTVVTSTMLRIVAETADQYRTGRPVWLLADYRFPHLVRAFPTRTAAEEARRDSTATLGLFGPYVTPRDSVRDPFPRVVSVKIGLRTAAGTTTTLEIKPEEADAIFLSMVSFDKFVVPYYSQLYGPEFARRLRQDALRAPRIIKHCASRACMPDSTGTHLRVLPLWDPSAWTPGGPADSLSR